MYNCLITFRAATHARRAAALFETNGCMCFIVRPPQEILSNACGYGVKIRRDYLDLALRLLAYGGIEHQRVFMVDKGRYECMQS